MTELEVTAFGAALTRAAIVIEDPPPEQGDLGDDYIISLAHAAGVDFIVSGDKHLTGLRDPDPPVLTPARL